MLLPISSVWKMLTATVFKLACIKSNGRLMKMQIVGPSLSLSFIMYGKVSGTDISNKFPGDADATGLGTTL